MAEETNTPVAAANGGETPRSETPRSETPRAEGPRGGRGPRPGGPGGREGGRKYFRRKKVCKFCVEKIESINYKDVRLLGQFVAERVKRAV
jgi:small subunit ribosomal protein S18